MFVKVLYGCNVTRTRRIIMMKHWGKGASAVSNAMYILTSFVKKNFTLLFIHFLNFPGVKLPTEHA